MRVCLVCLVCLAAGALILSSCSSAPPPAPDTHDADVKAVTDDLAQWQKDFAAKDLDKIASHYADDAVVANPGSPAVTGKDAAKASLKDLVGDPAFALTLSPAKIETSKSGDMAYARGSYQLSMTNPVTRKPINDKGGYLELYRKQADGAWKVAVDMATSETYWAIPPTPPAK